MRLLNYWASLRRSAGGPFFADFKRHGNPIPWGDCCLVFVGPEGDTVFEHRGAALQEIFELDEVLSSDAVGTGKYGVLFGDIRDALGTGRPCVREGDYARADGRMLYRSVLLPFVDIAGRPAYVLHAVSYKLRTA